MFDLKKRHSMILKVVSHETEFRRVALRRRSKGAVEDLASQTVSSGASGSYRPSGAALDPQRPQRRVLNHGTPLKPAVPPKPAHLPAPEEASRQKDRTPRTLRPPSTGSSLVASQCPTGEGKQTSSQILPAGPLTSRSPAGIRPVRRSDGTTPLGAPGPALRGARTGSHSGEGAERQNNPDSLSSRDAAHEQAKHCIPSLWRSRSHLLFRRSWVDQAKYSSARKEDPAGRRAVPQTLVPQTLVPQTLVPWDGHSPTAEPSELAPLTAPPSAPCPATRSPACKRKYYSSSAIVLSPESQGPSKDPTPCPVVTGPSPVVPGPVVPGPVVPGPVVPGPVVPGPVVPGPVVPGPVVTGPGPVVPGPGLRVGAGLELMHHVGGAQGPQGVGGSGPAPDKDKMSLEEERTHEDVGQHMDVENEEDEKESKRKEELHKIVTELLMTERAYVARLHLLDQVFCSRLSAEASRGSFPLEVVKNLFSNISSIHSFHSQFLLPDLEERMLHWWDRPALGDILLRHAPFLRMYAEYMGHFEPAMELLRTWRERSAAFRAVLQDIQSQEVCGRLSLEHHMLEPVQRVPRYEMLLKAYLRRLPEDDADRPLAEKALEAISMAAIHSNSAIHRAESLKKLLDIFEMVGEEEILKPSTEFLREGRLLKLAARNTSAMERYLFLFNDFLLCCTPRLVLVGQRYGVRTHIGVEGMEVQRTSNEEHPHSFQISGKEKTLELEASSEKDRDEWIKVIQEAIDVFHKKTETFKLASKESDMIITEEELGRRAPWWIRDNEVVECMRCQEAFNGLTRRRHHCRACGCVVCWKCSDHKLALEYDGKRLSKVCKACHGVLSGREAADPRGHGPHDTVKVALASGRGMSSFLTYGDDPKAQRRVWSVVPKSQPITLNLYATRQESCPLLTLPLPGSSLQASPGGFSLAHSASRHTFLCHSLELRQRWLATLREAGAEGPAAEGPAAEPEDTTTTGGRPESP